MKNKQDIKVIECKKCKAKTGKKGITIRKIDGDYYCQGCVEGMR